jgi:hypothetical protein
MMMFQKTRNRYFLFSAGAATIIWFMTFIILVSFTAIPVFYNKLICIIIVITIWLIIWYKNVRQYLLDLNSEKRKLTRLRIIMRCVINEAIHFIIMVSVLMVIMLFIGRFL